MNQDNNDVKKALDDIFGSDFIEIDSKNKEEASENNIEEENNIIETNELEQTNLENNEKPIIVNKEISDDEDIIKPFFQFDKNATDAKEEVKEEKEINDLEDTIQLSYEEKVANIENRINDIMSENDDKLVEEVLEQAIKNEKALNAVEIKESSPDDEKFNYSKKNLIIYFIIGILLGLILVFLIVNKNNSVEKKLSCTYSTKNSNFEITDEYIITHTGNKLLYVEGGYTYTAKTDEYKPQVEVIKEEKLPVVINSNGMPGYTHIYEISDTYFKISSYYDISLIDFAIADKNNSKVTPISYIALNSKTTYNSLKSELEKKDYKCVNTN